MKYFLSKDNLVNLLNKFLGLRQYVSMNLFAFICIIDFSAIIIPIIKGGGQYFWLTLLYFFEYRKTLLFIVLPIIVILFIIENIFNLRLKFKFFYSNNIYTFVWALLFLVTLSFDIIGLYLIIENFIKTH